MSGFLNSLPNLSVWVLHTLSSDNTTCQEPKLNFMAFIITLHDTIIKQGYFICRQICSLFPFQPFIRAHPTVCFHLSVYDHILALILLPVPPNNSLSVVVVVELVLMNSLHLAKCLLKCFPCHRQTCLKVKGLPLKCSLQLVAFAASQFTHCLAMCGSALIVFG